MVPFKREEGSQQPELPPAVDVIESKGGFGDCDLALFRTGAHADVRVICEDRQFDVHKAVLASRSAWFEQTLARMEQQQPQQLQQPGVLPTVTITSHKAMDLELIFIFIYAGEVDPKLSHQTSFTSSCVRLFDLGHDFAVTGMADFATNEMGNYLSLALRMIGDQRLTRPKQDPAGRSEIQDRLRENNFVSAYLLGVEAADAIRRPRGREDRVRPFQMLVDFFVAGKEVMLNEPEMEVFLDDDVVPSFARSVLLTERKGGARSKWLKGLVARPAADKNVLPGGLRLRSSSVSCCDCGRAIRESTGSSGPGVINPRSKVVSYTQACCAACSDRERNLDEHGLLKWEVFDPKKE